MSCAACSVTEVAWVFDKGWLLQYPWPVLAIHDLGPKFIGTEFQDLLTHAGIKDAPTTAHSPQVDSIIEAVHKSVGQVIQMLVHLQNPHSCPEAQALIQTACSTVMHATHCAAYQSLSYYLTSDAVAFHHDMQLDIPLVSDILTLQNHHQLLVDHPLLKYNASHTNHDTMPFMILFSRKNSFLF